MSKDLEREYKALVNSEVPDLWARIEAGLEDKKMTADSQMKTVRGKKVNVKMWAGLAAACVCVAMIVPAMARMMPTGSSGSYNNSAPQNDTPQAAESYEKAEGIAEVAADDASAAGENGMGSSVITSDNAGAAMDSNADTVHVASGGLEEAAAVEQEPYRFRVTVEILDIDASMDSNVLYTAKVITSENPVVQADSEITFISSAVGAVLEKSQTYDIVLYEEHSEDSDQDKKYLLANDAAE